MKRDTEQPASGEQARAPKGLAYLLSPQFAGIILRFFAVLRLLALIVLSAVLLHFSVIRPFWNSSPAERTFLFALFLANAPITALLWAGAFAGKWRCLPVYVVCEMVFCFWNLFRYYGAEDRKDDVFVLSVVLFLVFFSLFTPLILVRYYRFLREQYFERRNQLYGRVERTSPATQRERLLSPQTAGVALRFVAVVRLLWLNIIAAIMLQISTYGDIINESSTEPTPTMFMVLFLINATITALLWTGAFAGKRHCLPVYAICEMACSGWTIYLFMWFVRSDRVAVLFFLGVPFLVFFGLYITLIIVRYYRFLGERDQERKRHLYASIEQS